MVKYNEIPPVSDSKKEPSERVSHKPLTQAKQVKKGLLKRLLTGLYGNSDGVKDHIIKNVLGPAVKKVVVDMVTSSINMLIYKTPNNPNQPWNNGYTNYASSKQSYKPAYTNYAQPSQPYGHNPVNTKLNGIEQFVISTHGEAYEVLEYMRSIISEYGQASVADYYELVGGRPNFIDHSYGWFNLASAHVRASRGGFIIELPPVTQLPSM